MRWRPTDSPSWRIKVGLFNDAIFFWVVVGAIVAVAPLTIGFAKAKRWI